MRFFILLSGILTFASAAEGAGWLSAKTVSCLESQLSLTEDQLKDGSTGYVLAADNSKISIQREGKEFVYNLVAAGKEAYMASPSEPHEDPRYFFVRTKPNGYEIHSMRMASELCGGGLIVIAIERN